MINVKAAAAVAGVCFPHGWSSGAAAAHIRGDGNAARLDVALICSDRPASAAGVFTRNLVRAAPVLVSEEHVARGGPVSAVVINAGNANACTGTLGIADARAMCAQVAESRNVDPTAVLVCSTGVIGRPMPMDSLRRGIDAAAQSLTVGDDLAAATAIMTTDTVPKRACVTFSVDDRECRVGGMAKGAGMIHPNMATLLVLLTTDAPASAELLQSMLSRATDDTFNCVTVDGDTSTNDTALLLANGAGGGEPFAPGSDAAVALEAAVTAVCESLAEQVIADAEGAQRYFRVTVTGASSVAHARAAARTVALSPLVKTAIHGCDPNWGRIVAALGRSGMAFDLNGCTVTIGDVAVFAAGAPCDADLAAVGAAFAEERVEIAVALDGGTAVGHAWGCELSADYVRINADYTT